MGADESDSYGGELNKLEPNKINNVEQELYVYGYARDILYIHSPDFMSDPLLMTPYRLGD